MLETACRPGELLSPQWADVNLERGELTIRAAKSKTRTERILPISARLHGVLEMRQCDPAGARMPADAYVFGDAVGRQAKSVRKEWERVRDEVGLHGFGPDAVAGGRGMQEITHHGLGDPAVRLDEPVAEVHRLGDDVKVVVEMPGVSEEDLNIRLDGEELMIDAAGSIRTYHTHADVPPVDPKSLQHSLRNGVLEVTLHALPETPVQEPSGKI